MTLKELPVGKTAAISSVGGEGALRQHFLDMGVIPNADITLIKYAPMGNPMEFMIHGYELGAKWAVGVVIGQCVIAWIASLIVYQVGNLFI